MKKILIIDNKKDYYKAIGKFLHEHGYDVIFSQNGTDGIQKTFHELPHVILADTILPKLSGIEVYNTLQYTTQTGTIPFIFIPSDIKKLTIEEAMQMGADGYLPKPINFNELITVINTRLNKLNKIKKIYEKKTRALDDSPFTGLCSIENNTFVYCNKKILKITGLSLEGSNFSSFLDVVHKNDRELISYNINLCLKGVRNNFRLTAGIWKEKKYVLIDIYGKTIYNFCHEKRILLQILEVAKNTHNNEKEMFNPKNNTNWILGITKREKEILKLISEGYNSEEIANHLTISKRTVNGHRANLLAKTGAKNSVTLALFALREGIIS